MKRRPHALGNGVVSPLTITEENNEDSRPNFKGNSRV